MRRRFRWSSPGGLHRGAARLTREEAMVEGVAAGTNRSARGLDADAVLSEWRTLAAQGWSIEELP